MDQQDHSSLRDVSRPTLTYGRRTLGAGQVQDCGSLAAGALLYRRGARRIDRSNDWTAPPRGAAQPQGHHLPSDVWQPRYRRKRVDRGEASTCDDLSLSFPSPPFRPCPLPPLSRSPALLPPPSTRLSTLPRFPPTSIVTWGISLPSCCLHPRLNLPLSTTPAVLRSPLSPPSLRRASSPSCGVSTTATRRRSRGSSSTGLSTPSGLRT